MNLAETIKLMVDSGFVLRRIAPADDPRIAELEDPDGLQVVLRHGPDLASPGPLPPPGTVRRSPPPDSAVAGRAGLQYRDLLEDRLNGHVIASLITVADGGPVDDYVHHHRIGFQLIHCRRGWVDVVYGEQGPPFRMVEGDSVLQPPGIRHRVLAASDGLEVFEVGSPAEHDTLADPERVLPDPGGPSEAVYGNDQRFVWAHDVAFTDLGDGWSCRTTGIGDASNGAGEVVTLRAEGSAGVLRRPVAAGRVWLGFVDRGAASIGCQTGGGVTDSTGGAAPDSGVTVAGELVAVVGPVTVELDPDAQGCSVIEVDLAAAEE